MDMSYPTIAMPSSYKTSPALSPSEDRMLNTRKAAEFLSLSPDTLKNYRRSGIGPNVIRLNPKVCRYRLSDLMRYVSDMEQQ